MSPFDSLQLGQDYNLNADGVPVLEDVERVLVCARHEVFGVQDHEIWVGKVLEVLEKADGKSGGLLNYNRGFHKVGSGL